MYGSIAETYLRIVNPKQRKNVTRRCPSLSGADAFIQSCPAGTTPRWAKGGVLLSGGKKQRISLARALLLNANIVPINHLHLDESSRNPSKEGFSGLLIAIHVILISHDPTLS